MRLAYLGKNHGGNLLGGEGLGLAKVLDLNDGVAGTALLNNLEGPRLDVLLDNGIAERPANQSPVMDSY
jgi:hypothetical protein